MAFLAGIGAAIELAELASSAVTAVEALGTGAGVAEDAATLWTMADMAATAAGASGGAAEIAGGVGAGLAAGSGVGAAIFAIDRAIDNAIDDSKRPSKRPATEQAIEAARRPQDTYAMWADQGGAVTYNTATDPFAAGYDPEHDPFMTTHDPNTIDRFRPGSSMSHASNIYNANDADDFIETAVTVASKTPYEGRQFGYKIKGASQSHAPRIRSSRRSSPHSARW